MRLAVSQENWFPVLLTSATDFVSGITGVTYDAPGLEVTFSKAGESPVPKTLAAGDWQEFGHGVYKLKFSATECNTLGLFLVVVEYPGAINYPGQAEIYIPPSGEGAVTWTYTLTNTQTGLPIPDAEIWVTTDVSGTNRIAGPQRTNALGEVTFHLDSGTYYIWRQKVGFNFVNPDTEIV